MKIFSFRHSMLFSLILVGGIFVFNSCAEDDNGIADPLDLPKITFSDLSIDEDDVDQTVVVDLKLEGSANANAVANFLVSGGSAEAGIDYEVKTASPLVFTEGESSKTLTILIKGDEVVETKETIEITFYNPKNVTLPVSKLTITIKDDDDNTAGLVIPKNGYTTPKEYSGMTLEWADEFDGSTLNTNWWTFETGDGCPNNCGWGNNELQYYREDNTSVVDGHLVITAKKQA
ncbi:MAG TPA: Calx-beta domain-containing protein, partial [Saprospiraceae bacterium]|nr:Calx-beta domain-containing protein [Saprospiraceae bacterium]